MNEFVSPRQTPRQDGRAALRKRLRALRAALSPDERADRDARIAGWLRTLPPLADARVIGAYWPVHGEPDLRALLTAWHQAGRRIALPEIEQKNQPLRFRQWSPDAPLTAGQFGIPVPAAGALVEPDLLLVPCLGFNAQRYRLGYGGGYYDRTLHAGAARGSRTDSGMQAIGVAYECGRLDDFYHAGHDHPLDAIVTEAGVL